MIAASSSGVVQNTCPARPGTWTFGAPQGPPLWVGRRKGGSWRARERQELQFPPAQPSRRRGLKNGSWSWPQHPARGAPPRSAPLWLFLCVANGIPSATGPRRISLRGPAREAIKVLTLRCAGPRHAPVPESRPATPRRPVLSRRGARFSGPSELGTAVPPRGSKIRLISGRRATRHERRDHEEAK